MSHDSWVVVMPHVSCDPEFDRYSSAQRTVLMDTTLGIDHYLKAVLWQSTSHYVPYQYIFTMWRLTLNFSNLILSVDLLVTGIATNNDGAKTEIKMNTENDRSSYYILISTHIYILGNINAEAICANIYIYIYM